MTVYLDASFVVSLYSPDTNSELAAETLRQPHRRYLISALAELECTNALQLRVFRKQISAAQAKSSLHNFQSDLRSGLFQLVRVEELVFERARQIAIQTTARLGTRTADLLHVACALAAKADSLYSFDQQQRRLAEAMKLKLNCYKPQ